MKANSIVFAPILSLGLGLITSAVQAENMTFYNDQRDPVTEFNIMKSDKTWGPNEIHPPLPAGQNRVISFQFANGSECSRNVFTKTSSGNVFRQMHDFAATAVSICTPTVSIPRRTDEPMRA
jgi:hypothetical protein